MGKIGTIIKIRFKKTIKRIRKKVVEMKEKQRRNNMCSWHSEGDLRKQQ